MTNTATLYRNMAMHSLYKRILKPVFFKQDPEDVHDRMTNVGAMLGKHSLGRAFTRRLFDFQDETLSQSVCGIAFKNPIGLSAGFDKNAQLMDILPSVGFGFVEVGSITGEKCPGNPKPRLWRLPKSEGLVVWYGLKNDGSEEISNRLAGKHFDIPVGVSVAATNCADNLIVGNAMRDFAKAFRLMEPIGDYMTVNISCPNAKGGQTFIDPVRFNELFDILDDIPTKKPVFIKLSPDLSHSELDAILDVAHSHRIDGIITTNLTKKRDNPKIVDLQVPTTGGMSGKVVADLSDDALAYIAKRQGDKHDKKLVLIASGGVFTAEDAYKKIRLGASLVQMITGMIFEGPQVISEINRGLVDLLKKDGYPNISQAVGADIGKV
ncbi:MAG: quinone-dependent dihydroorotate dehydrogenase [Candidatus Pacebacteria bacterium]|nr:quinone-dependent dihydroorotate dehydrogenase [Candidatus Paceibacterota bacterium]